jgi:hypothetical protein
MVVFKIESPDIESAERERRSWQRRRDLCRICGEGRLLETIELGFGSIENLTSIGSKVAVIEKEFGSLEQVVKFAILGREVIRHQEAYEDAIVTSLRDTY